MDDEIPDVEQMVTERIYQSIARRMIANGAIDAEGLGVVDVRKLVAEFLLENADEVEFQIVLDHRGELLEQARRQCDEGRPDYAIMFYATWMEHSINEVLATFSGRVSLGTAARIGDRL